MFGFPQSLDPQDVDSGAESEQAMLPPSLNTEYNKPGNAAVLSFDVNSGLTVCQHLRGEEGRARRREGEDIGMRKGEEVLKRGREVCGGVRRRSRGLLRRGNRYGSEALFSQ